ncbi:hypothetical protein CVT25_015067 [Psilocybe cyanescens]|uniref:Asl1-like glycosyl hydrolase catalytic domain-containing protein n=1 Tax=Psilocybe cyanescens TaxID=93625 RepID=A0A409WRY5_PSICY|nr:hypothetical protein CVT25_015067 [Psilocybe cyanescens]
MLNFCTWTNGIMSRRYGTGIMHGQFPHWHLWVTEFASTSSNKTEVAQFIDGTTRWLNSLDWIEGYCWFAFFASLSFLHRSVQMLKVNHCAKKVSLPIVHNDSYFHNCGNASLHFCRSSGREQGFKHPREDLHGYSVNR